MAAAPRNAVSLFNFRYLAFTVGYNLLLNGSLFLFCLLLVWVDWQWTGKLSFGGLWNSVYFCAATLVGLGLGLSYRLGVMHGLRTQMKGIPAQAWSEATLRIGQHAHQGRLWAVEDMLHFQGGGQTLQLTLDELGEVEMSGWLQPQLQWYANGQRYQLQAPDAWGWHRVLTA